MLRRTLIAALSLGLLFLPEAFAQNMPQIFYLRFNEGSGTTTADLAVPGVGSAPALQGTTTWSTSPQLGASAITTTASTVDRVVTNVANTITGSWTMELWLYDTLAPTNTALRYALGETATQFRLFAGGVAGNNNVILRGNTITDTTVLGAAQQNVWVHVAFVYDSTLNTITPYLNGVAQGAVAQAVTPSLTFALPGLGIGGFPSGGYTGSVDEFRFWNVARTPTDIATYMNTELSNSPPKSIRLAQPRPPIFFNPGQGTFTCNGTVGSFTDDLGLVTNSSVADPLVGAAVTVNGTYSGSDILQLTDITLSPCNIQFTVAPTTDELALITQMSIGATLGDYVDLAGGLNGLPTRFRTLGEIGTPISTRTGAGSSALDRMNTAMTAGETVTLICPLEGGGPTLNSIERSYTLTPPSPRHAFVTDGFGAALIGVVGCPAGGLLFNIFALNNAGPVGTGPFFGIPFTAVVVDQLSMPSPTNPYKVFANADGAYFWGCPPGSVPAGITIDLVTIAVPPGASQASFVSPVTRVTF